VAGRESQRRRRKRRTRSPAAEPPAGSAVEAPAGSTAEPPAGSKDDTVRRNLVPLREGERPASVTVAAVVAGLIALSNAVAWLAGLEVEGRSFSAGEVLPTAVLMMVAAVGMWRSRYWAVLGFQTILAFLIVVMSLALITAENLLGVAVALAIIGAAGTLFWFLVKAMARIQMPVRRPPAG
jgi:hypothetical protein